MILSTFCVNATILIEKFPNRGPTTNNDVMTSLPGFGERLPLREFATENADEEHSSKNSCDEKVLEVFFQDVEHFRRRHSREVEI